MMGVGPDEARRLTWWEYTAMLSVWNERHETQSDPVEAPDAEKVRRNMQRLNGIRPAEMRAN